MKKITLVILFLSLQLAYSKNEHINIDSTKDFFPLQIGNCWKYFDYETENTNCKIFLNIKVIDTTEILGLKYFKMQFEDVIPPWGPNPDTSRGISFKYYRKVGKNLYTFNDSLDQLLYNFEADSGAKWYYKEYLSHQTLNCERSIRKKNVDSIKIYHECIEITDSYGAEGFIANIGPIYFWGFMFDYQLIGYDLISSVYTDNSNNQTNMNIFPNPFSESITINYELQAASRVKIDIFSSLGEKITTLVDEWQEVGRHNATFDVGTHCNVSLQSGMYFYRIQVGERIESGKIILIR